MAKSKDNEIQKIQTYNKARVREAMVVDNGQEMKIGKWKRQPQPLTFFKSLPLAFHLYF